MIRLSVVIITYNEERNIGRCLESVRGIADDIVVLDSFSTDKTEDICKEHGARFIRHKFEGHIEQKNRAVSLASYPHVLSLDADEALDDTLRESISRVKENWKHDGYTMNRLTNYCGKWIYHCGWYPDRKLRLWDSRKGRWGGENPHDRYELTEKDATTAHLEGNILHYSYYTLNDHHRQVEYFTTILARTQFNNGKRAPWPVMVISPVIKFLRDYFIKLGILDGRAGFTISRISAYATYLKYRKIRQLQQSKNKLG
ncbi:glycosyltransferase family 2 protein [Lentimicrobium sp.]|jgi:glycosyltransferase involved in cell wall biosynthesis|uniref:glycosyltransferase family 2 protein n=2 Tax=Lentimicrobium sp. TaxID=2034841 RepID=UPI0025E16BA0|nr:glycosyltransferase family 2 protein [Lentimicrobium sp.]MCO5256159.1 glycosyltransferase family 2 protein [Lentimicrobium sp.]MCO5262011.1 glycosyltransferase family 2 protein [Lentimicrobium sp.]HOP13067.1 glycosyltransferase family 2 protein [Lentimicrobium sp.]HPF64075.1 glycosyltransferase family 2 protein [Lentimicrobium sp.]HPJ61337.1 glycosyltransferase family 2 protein [Lentimicrobium sp.]